MTETTDLTPEPADQPVGVSPPPLLGLLGAGVAVGAGAVAGADAAFVARPPRPPCRRWWWRSHGQHQAGIVTPAQDRLHFVSFDLSPQASRDDVVTLLKAWTVAAASMCAGNEVGTGGAADGPPASPPTDTGEAQGLSPANLTLTVGFGPSLFDKRFGLAARRPAQLADLPAFAGDALDPPDLER